MCWTFEQAVEKCKQANSERNIADMLLGKEKWRVAERNVLFEDYFQDAVSKKRIRGESDRFDGYFIVRYNSESLLWTVKYNGGIWSLSRSVFDFVDTKQLMLQANTF